MKKLIIALFALTTILMFSCKKETADNVNQDKIWTEYYLEYNNATGITSARAVFKFSNATGTLLELTDSASIKFNGDALTYNAILGYYEKQYPSYVQSGSFTYKDLDHNTFINNISMCDTSNIPVIDTITKANPYTFTWTGSALGNNERINVWINSNIEGDARLFTTANVGATNIIFPANQISQLGVGPYGTIVMERVWQPATQQTTSAGGIMSSKYIPKKRTGIFIQ
ncbi:MAG: hypothetical protein M9897_03610 [Brumimicrobium sp.]|nr:hypothetical protein [Brumimicrobium sp.]